MKLHDRTELVLKKAKKEAKRLGHKMVSSDHFFVGMVLEGKGVLAQYLFGRDTHIDVDEVRAAALRVSSAGEHKTGEDMDHTSLLEVALIMAEEKAIQMGDEKICPIHVLLVMLEHGHITLLLRELGVKLVGLAEELMAMYQEKKQPTLKLNMLVGLAHKDGISVNVSFDIAREGEQKALLKAVNVNDDWIVENLIAKIRKKE